ncbi:Uncharacterised protein [Yersinia enterocolitica]|nr:Uncharacterised protein [Yersinia enterocolitica]
MDASPAGLVRFDNIAVSGRFVLLMGFNPLTGNMF